MTQPFRAPAIAVIKRFTPTFAQQHLRPTWVAQGHPSGATRAGDTYGGVQRNSPPGSRFLSTTASMKTTDDSSTIDFAHTPQADVQLPSLPEVMRPPLLPDNDSPPPGIGAPDQDAIEPVIRPEISTVCADGTHIDTPSAMSEVTDNHAAELDPYDLSSKVTAAGAKVTDQAKKKVEDPGSVKAVWSGLLDDLLGEKKFSKE